MVWLRAVYLVFAQVEMVADKQEDSKVLWMDWKAADKQAGLLVLSPAEYSVCSVWCSVVLVL